MTERCLCCLRQHYCAAYFGGDDDDYDVLKHTSSTVVSGDATALRRAAAPGVPEPELRSLLNATDLAIYWVVNVWAGNTDWYVKSSGSHRQQNNKTYSIFSQYKTVCCA